MNASIKASIEHRVLPMQGWCSLEKALFIAECCNDPKVNFYLELGVFAGKSIIPACIAFADKGHGFAFGVDPFAVNPALIGNNTPENDAWWKALDFKMVESWLWDSVNASGVQRFFGLLKMSSVDSLPVIKATIGGKIDVLHIDSNHSTDVSMFEAKSYIPLVKSDGIIIMDDVNWNTVKPTAAYVQSVCGEPIVSHAEWCAFKKP